MENRTYFKKYLSLIVIFGIVFSLGILLLSHLEYEHDKVVFNKKINAIISEVKNKYTDISDEEILEILSAKNGKTEALKKYGYDLERDDFIKKNSQSRLDFAIAYLGFSLGITTTFIIVFFAYSKRHDSEIEKLISTLEKINHHNYDLELPSESEDKMSILKSEIYKTTVMLREVANNSKEDKIALKNTLSDISHQLKTPLTSILIMLDDIINDRDMDEDVREKFLNNIRREIMNINFLVQTILKLSKLDANAIEFTRDKVELEDLIDICIENTSAIADLKTVHIKKNIKNKIKIYCDATWQTEALSNIVKNAIEHSPENGVVEITIDVNDLYAEIAIKDYGEGMSREDMKHIFDRFYKGKNASKDSVGIGLSLAKTIIERDNGKISIESIEGKYTIFKIKYFY